MWERAPERRFFSHSGKFLDLPPASLRRNPAIFVNGLFPVRDLGILAHTLIRETCQTAARLVDVSSLSHVCSFIKSYSTWVAIDKSWTLHARETVRRLFRERRNIIAEKMELITTIEMHFNARKIGHDERDYIIKYIFSVWTLLRITRYCSRL